MDIPRDTDSRKNQMLSMQLTRSNSAPASFSPQETTLAPHNEHKISSFSNLVKRTDVYMIIAKRDSSEFIQQLREPSVGAFDERAKIMQMLGNIDAIKDKLKNSNIPLSMRKSFFNSINGMEKTLKALQTDKPLGKHLFQFASASLLSATLALAIPLASKPRQSQYASEMSGLMAKMLVETGVMISMPTANSSLQKERWLSRNMANTYQSIYFLPAIFKPSLINNVLYNVAGGLSSVALLFGTFLRPEICEKFNSYRGKLLYPSLTESGLNLAPETKQGLNEIFEQVNKDIQSLVNTKNRFEEQHAINPLIAKQVSLIVKSYDEFAKKLKSSLSIENELAISNPDRNAKLALAAFTSLICFSGAALMYPDKIGLVDLGADSVFTSLYQFSLVGNGNVSRSDALDEFKTFSGFSLILVGMLAANKGLNNFMDEGTAGLLIGGISMAALNLTLPGPVGDLTARGIEKILNIDYKEIYKNIGNKLYSYFNTNVQQNISPQTADGNV